MKVDGDDLCVKSWKIVWDDDEIFFDCDVRASAEKCSTSLNVPKCLRVDQSSSQQK